MTYRPITKSEFCKFITDSKDDAFTKTFITKCDFRKFWDKVTGLWEGNELLGASVYTLSKRAPVVANFQLLHTFAKHRGKGVGSALLQWNYDKIAEEADYFRLTAEKDALGFYFKKGLKFWGEQKGGCILCMFKINGNKISDGIYDETDEKINKTLFSNMKGSIYKKYDKLLCAE